MKRKLYFEAIPIGFAMFSMFFGAGNIIFPLAIGQMAGTRHATAIFGLLITAVLMPFAGVLAMILFEGDYRSFFGRLGRTPGFLLAFAVISLLGPLGSTPRCIALIYSTLKNSLPFLSPIPFCAGTCLLILLLTIRKNQILRILGVVLTPILLVSLAAIVFLGLTHSSEGQTGQPSGNLFMHGLLEGYNMMDLLAAFFFSSTILTILKERFSGEEEGRTDSVHMALQASMIGALLLAVVYVGFSSIAAFHGSELGWVAKEELLGAISLKIAGPYAGILVCTIISFACLTTAIALISVFSDFVQKELFQERISYAQTLIAALLVTFLISICEFSGISRFLGPILQISYPGLIMLTFLNILHKTTGFQPLKGPVFLTFGVSAVWYLCA